MKIFKYALFAILALALLTSSVPSGVNRLEEGHFVNLESLSNVLNDSNINLKGKKILINFWNSKDPQSRINNILYAKMIENTEDVQYISVSVSDDNILANEIIKNDGILNDKNIVVFKGDYNDELLREFQVRSGNRSFLIDENGKLEAISPISI